MDLKSLIRDVPDFPKPGILFRDITPLLRHPEGLRHTIDLVAEKCAAFDADCIAGIESRGFIFGVPVAYRLGMGFIPVRKAGKLPAAVHSVDYSLEYGQATLEIHCDALEPGHRVVIVDDLLATGGTAAATAHLVQKAGSEVAGFAFIVELLDLGGRQKLPDVPIATMIQY
ncbi:MAG: adenine phosphoribosyltransferase [Coleofasciculaceae cyanobacterium SM2_3_26]|nr:adenine phosphoribosyltransferase [Coleofasciculaceae cyanobacterium SM2_3_26]